MSRGKRKAADRRSVRTIEIAGNIPCDIDAAGIALSQARGILDLLSTACVGVHLPDAEHNTLELCVFAALAEVKRADAAIFGEDRS